MSQSETKRSHARGKQSNLRWISSNWKSPVLLFPDSEKKTTVISRMSGNNVQCPPQRREDKTRPTRHKRKLKKSWGLKQRICAPATISGQFQGRLLRSKWNSFWIWDKRRQSAVWIKGSGDMADTLLGTSVFFFFFSRLVLRLSDLAETGD